MNTDPTRIENPVPHPGGCPTGKVEHPDMAAAERERDRLTVAYGLVFNAYHCDLCGKYHTGKDRFCNPPEVLNTTMEEFRVVDSELGPVIPMTDVAKRLGKDRSTLSRLTRKPENKDLFEGMISTQPLETPHGRQFCKCITREGLKRLIDLLRPVSRDGFAGKQAQYRLSNIGKAPCQRAKTLDEDLDEAKHLAEKCGKPADLFLAVVLRKHGKKEFADLLTQPLATPSSAGQPGIWMTPTDIGNECGLSPREVNSWLYNHDFQYPQGSIWRLTSKGEEYGEEYEYPTPYKHTETRIRWNRSVLIASGLKRPAPGEPLALPQRASAEG
jgi:hypothetical protein